MSEIEKGCGNCQLRYLVGHLSCINCKDYSSFILDEKEEKDIENCSICGEEAKYETFTSFKYLCEKEECLVQLSKDEFIIGEL